MRPIIKIDHLGKRYRIGQREPYRSLRESLTNSLRAPLRYLDRSRRAAADCSDDHIWALNDLSLDVMPGEVLGVIGRNGAGKSTLLKILSRITEPTTGRIDLYGRVASLLEVGTGFHPELTGRENVFLNGAILGMKRAEIQRKFDEIVAFAEIEKFIDTPVKHYSSGMFVRLAFSVAAHLEPDILLVDEVLAVGDAAFWQKSTDRMRELNARGMTIFVVTHNMWLVQTVCTRAIFLDRGVIKASGPPRNVIAAYRDASSDQGNDRPAAPSPGSSQVTNLELLPAPGWISHREARPDSPLRIAFEARVEGRPEIKCRVRVTSTDNFPFYTVYSDLLPVPQSGAITGEVTIPELMLKAGDYHVWLGICSSRSLEETLADASLPFSVTEIGDARERTGVVWNRAHWAIDPLDSTTVPS